MAPLLGLALATAGEVAVADLRPGWGDHTVLSWREGPPYLATAQPADVAAAGYASSRRFLRLATGHFAADFDTERIDVTGFLRRPRVVGEEALAQETLQARPLPPAGLVLEVRVGEVAYRCTGRRPLALTARGQPVVPLEFPVRLIEGGRFFQKFSLHGLEFRSAEGRLLAADARLEVSAWPDRLTLMLVVKPESGPEPVRASLRLAGESGVWDSGETAAVAGREPGECRTVLAVAVRPGEVAGADDVVVRVQPLDPVGRASVAWEAGELAPWIRLEVPRWPAPKEGGYPEAQLDAWEAWDVTVENRSGQARRFGLNFDYVPARSIISYVPLILEPGGAPSGLPVQVSKNWHRPKSGVELPHGGAWMHGRTWLELPAHGRVAFRYGTTFARWGGVPAASAAQLSLVGWGHNGFWDQLALGAFGESICLQPGRVMRRSYLTDFRPLFQLGYARDERWAWTGNVGGGDTMVRVDPEGRYVPFQRNVTRYASHGPNLAAVVHDEVSTDGAVWCRTEVMVPRGDDCLRVYLRIRQEVRRRFEFSRLAFFQLGADFYNDPDAPLIAWGDAEGLRQEFRPEVQAGVRLRPAWLAGGDQPWVSLHGERRDDRSSTGQASRGLIVREWRARLGGRDVPAPFVAAVGSRGNRPHLAAELVPPPDLRALEAGDFVEALLELLPVPLAAERYYGPDEALAAALRTGANTWRPIQREASGNRPEVRLAEVGEVRSWPPVVPLGSAPEVRFSLRGGLGWIPVRVAGALRPGNVELWEVTDHIERRVWQGGDDRPYWQADPDLGGGGWNLTYNLPSSPETRRYLVRQRPSAVPLPLASP